MKALPAQEAKEYSIPEQDSAVLFICFINEVIYISKPNKQNILSPAMIIVSGLLIVFITLFIAKYY